MNAYLHDDDETGPHGIGSVAPLARIVALFWLAVGVVLGVLFG